jgi:hypothetical protein
MHKFDQTISYINVHKDRFSILCQMINKILTNTEVFHLRLYYIIKYEYQVVNLALTRSPSSMFPRISYTHKTNIGAKLVCDALFQKETKLRLEEAFQF